MIIEKVTQEEIPAVKKLLSFIWSDTYKNVYPPGVIEKITSVWHDPKVLAQQASDMNTFFAVAKESGEMTGLVTARKVNDTLHIGRLYIRPDYQRQGIGTYLMNAAIEYFPDIQRVKLECEKENSKALSFYKKQGYKTTNEKEENIEGVVVKTVEMEKSLVEMAGIEPASKEAA